MSGILPADKVVRAGFCLVLEGAEDVADGSGVSTEGAW
jgi:hypothetical protein